MIKISKVVSLPAPAPRLARVTQAQQHTLGRVLAAAASGFVSYLAFRQAHSPAQYPLVQYGLVCAGLAYSAPTLAKWVQRWAGNAIKAWGFTVILEGTMTTSTLPDLSYPALALLMAINAYAAFTTFSKAPKGKARQ